MAARVTRRELAAALAAPALLAQAPAPPVGDAQAVQEQIRGNRALLDKVEIPAGVEPAVHFKA
jgi:hypothetical protein